MREANTLTALEEQKRRQDESQNLKFAQDMYGTATQKPQTASGAIYGIGTATREQTLAESMAFRADREQENAERSRKAARILIEHPEFEDFIWLLRSGQI